MKVLPSALIRLVRLQWMSKFKGGDIVLGKYSVKALLGAGLVAAVLAGNIAEAAPRAICGFY